MTIESEGITMPKWADTVVTHNITGIHADAKNKIFFTFSSSKNKKTTGIRHLRGARYHRGFNFDVNVFEYSVPVGFYRPLRVFYIDTVDPSIKKTDFSSSDIPVRSRRLSWVELS
jgi:hypothetical protein